MRGLKFSRCVLGFATAKEGETCQTQAAEREGRRFRNGGDADAGIIYSTASAITVFNDSQAPEGFWSRVANTHRRQAFGNSAGENLAAGQLGAIKRKLIRRAVILHIVTAARIDKNAQLQESRTHKSRGIDVIIIADVIASRVVDGGGHGSVETSEIADIAGCIISGLETDIGKIDVVLAADICDCGDRRTAESGIGPAITGAIGEIVSNGLGL